MLRLFVPALLWTVTCKSVKTPELLPRRWDPAFSLPLSDGHKVIVLVTMFRSGSTFFGELFNENPNVLYDFESFHGGALKNKKGHGLFLGEDSRHTDDEINMLNLQQILYNCSILPSPFGGVLNKYWRCAETPEENKMLFEEEECDNHAASWKGMKIQEARRYLCKKKDAVVLKVIRLRRIRDLDLIKDIDKADLKVIHLLRDPRGMFRSRSGFKDIFQTGRYQVQWTKEERYQKLALEAHTECERYMSDIEFAENSPWLKPRYLKIKHDRMGTHPIETAEEIYKFVGLPLPDIVREFLKEAVSSQEVKAKPANAGDTGRGGALDTFKNSTQVNEKWHQWRFNSIKNVDKHCARFIKKMNWPFLLDPWHKNYEQDPGPEKR